MITERLPLICLSVVRAMMSAAVPEHSICAVGTPRSSASVVPRESTFARGRKSRHRRGRPAVGGTSRQRSGMAVLRLAEAQQNDAEHDAGRAGQLCGGYVFAEQDDGNDQNGHYLEMRCRKCR